VEQGKLYSINSLENQWFEPRGFHLDKLQQGLFFNKNNILCSKASSEHVCIKWPMGKAAKTSQTHLYMYLQIKYFRRAYLCCISFKISVPHKIEDMASNALVLKCTMTTCLSCLTVMCQNLTTWVSHITGEGSIRGSLNEGKWHTQISKTINYTIPWHVGPCENISHLESGPHWRLHWNGRVMWDPQTI